MNEQNSIFPFVREIIKEQRKNIERFQLITILEGLNIMILLALLFLK